MSPHRAGRRRSPPLRAQPLLAALAMLAALCAGAVPARAAALAVSADIPIVYTFNNQDIARQTSLGGVLVSVALPGFLGAGVESYRVKGQVSNPTPANTDFTYDVAMLDLLLDLPFPGGNLVLGAGAGRGRFSTALGTPTFSDASLVQAFFSVGVRFAEVYDAHVGYHAVRGAADLTGGGGQLNLDANMATVGLKMTF
jgi:hypothetical protein